MSKSQFEHISHRRLLGILMAVGFFMLMFGNGMLNLTHPDEVFYILSAREMVQHHSWLTPMIFNHIQFEKPILSYALFAGAIKFFGDGPFVARFWPAFFGIIGVGVAYWIAWMLFARKKIAFLSAIILVSSALYTILSRAVLTDMIFTTLISCSIGFFYLGIRSPKNQWRGMVWGFFFSALAVLTKGILGFVFPVGTMVLYLCWTKQLKNIHWRSVGIGFVFFLIIAVPWHVLMYQKYGQFFIQEYFQNVHFRRFFEAEHPRMNKFYFYPLIMLWGVLPWSFFWILTIQFVGRNLNGQQYSDSIKLLLSWVLCVFVPVELAASKLASYIFPLFPALGILLGSSMIYAMDEKKDKTPQRRSIKLAAWLTCSFLMILSFGLIVMNSRINAFFDGKLPTILLSFLIFFSGLIVIIFCYRKEYARMILGVSTLVPILLIGTITVVPQLEARTSCKEICEVFKKLNKPDQLIFSSKILVRAVSYYTGNPVAVIDVNGSGFWSQHPIPYFNLDQKLIEYMNKNKELYAIIRDKTMEDFERLSQSQPYEVKELYSGGGKKIIHVIKRED